MFASDSRLLVIFSKNPVAGEVKTRLAISVGNEKALEIYEALRGITARIVSGVQSKRVVFYSDFIPKSDLLLTPGTDAKLQQGRELGERMHNAICEGLSSGARHVVLIGTDCPDISGAVIEKAFSLLESNDAVLGPAKDGGFYLIGLKKPSPEVFLERTWSTGTVLDETIRRFEATGAAIGILPELRDIDTLEDLQQSRLQIEGTTPDLPG
ncbi:MAG: glycosyltransferase [Chlorobiaceae bacterium]|nr:glycosyltransferase [Chlorobiaceae bacterium]NTW11573.1 glycosyltransferase [Chlorobiaceae bacterium]